MTTTRNAAMLSDMAVDLKASILGQRDGHIACKGRTRASFQVHSHKQSPRSKLEKFTIDGEPEAL